MPCDFAKSQFVAYSDQIIQYDGALKCHLKLRFAITIKYAANSDPILACAIVSCDEVIAI